MRIGEAILVTNKFIINEWGWHHTKLETAELHLPAYWYYPLVKSIQRLNKSKFVLEPSPIDRFKCTNGIEYKIIKSKRTKIIYGDVK